MGKKNISKEKIIQSFLRCAFEKSAGATSLSDIADDLEIKKASLYNHFGSREAMYNASIEYCEGAIKGIKFLPITYLQTIKNNKTTPVMMFKHLIARFFEIYENDPFFAMYSFIHTEQYFNINALNIVKAENSMIREDIKSAINAFIASGQIEDKGENEIEDASQIIGSVIVQKLDFYIANRKEIVRQNPDSGVGSLFALPTDETEVNNTTKIVGSYLNEL